MVELKKILIVDDDAAYIDMLEAKLYFANYIVLRANGGEEAYEVATKEKPSLIILDIKMPGKDGFQVSVELLKNEASKDIPVLFLSGLQDTDDSKTSENIKAHPNMILSKTVPNDQLLSVIRQLLGEE